MDVGSIQAGFSQASVRLNQYVNSLTDLQKYSWLAIFIGILLVILAIVMW
ncbi:MAG: hypothetical protein ABIA93_03620 [Candidatus Woesearchaeota archaeon]